MKIENQRNKRRNDLEYNIRILEVEPNQRFEVVLTFVESGKKLYYNVGSDLSGDIYLNHSVTGKPQEVISLEIAKVVGISEDGSSRTEPPDAVQYKVL